MPFDESSATRYVDCHEGRAITHSWSGLEKWYVGGSLVLAFVQPIVPAALGHFGEDPVYESW